MRAAASFAFDHQDHQGGKGVRRFSTTAAPPHLRGGLVRFGSTTAASR